MKKTTVFTTLVVCLLASSSPMMGQTQTTPAVADKPVLTDATVPDPFRPLYQELDESLRQAQQLYPFQKGNARPLIAPSLAMASSFYSPSAADPQRWNDLLATLDAFKAMRMNAVSVEIAAPDLALGDTESLLDFYQRLAAEIHARHMKLYVEHFFNTPFEPNTPPHKHSHKDILAAKTFQDNPQGRQEFLNILEQENTLIYREIKPDYLSILTEPQVSTRLMLHLTFTADELARWVGDLTTRLKNTGASPGTLLGAGALTYESEDFVLKFAQQANLDYVDMHVYSLKMKDEDQVAKLTALVGKVRESRPNMPVTIGEAWLFKNGKAGPKAPYPEIFARDNFSLWSPLDAQFLKLLMGIAQKENISVVAPSFSQYFFAYYTLGDAESSRLPPWPHSIPQSWNKAFEAVRNHQLSPTGKAISAMLEPAAK